MKFKLERATEKPIDFEGAKVETARKSFWGEDKYYSYSIEIDSLEKLLEIAKINERGIIIDKCRPGSPYEWRIQIYDCYIE